VALWNTAEALTATQLQLVISLDGWPGDQVFDVQGIAGSYTARDARDDGLVVRGPTLEAVADQIHAAPVLSEPEAGAGVRLRWVRPLTAIGSDGLSTRYPLVLPTSPSEPLLDEFRWWIVWRLGAPVLLVTLLIATAPDAAAAWSAHLGHGKPGTWTFTESTCNGRVCEGWGRFTSDDGTDVRDGARMFDTPQTLNPGETVRAVSIDDHRLYPVGGGGTWLTTLVADLAMIALLAVWAWRVPRWVWRRARRRRRERQRR
jgi:hypothetical protein